YIEEVPSGVKTIVGVSTSIAAFVGYTARGPTDEAVRIHNFGDFEQNFGGLHRDSLISYGVRQFFLNGGTDAYIVRVAEGANVATVTLEGDAAGTKVLQVDAANCGEWGNFIRLDIDYNTNNPDSTFNISISRYEMKNGELELVESELFRNLSMDSHSGFYVESVINNESKLIKVTRDPSLTFSEDGYSLSGKFIDQDISAFTSNETTITGFLDGSEKFTLILDNTLIDENAASLSAYLISIKNEITAAIGRTGLSSKMNVIKSNCFGGTTSPLEHLKIKSIAASKKEHSSIQIIKSPNNDASAKLKLGLHNGGREVDGSSEWRPKPTGTFSADLADIWDTAIGSAAANFNIIIKDELSGNELLGLTNIILPATTVGEDLRRTLETQLRGAETDEDIRKKITVELHGTYLRVLPNVDYPNATIKFSNGTKPDSSPDDLAETKLKLIDTVGFCNLQQNSVGTGVDANYQTNLEIGSNGIPPSTSDLIIGTYDQNTGMYALKDVDIFNILSIPGTTKLPVNDAAKVISDATVFCEEERAIFIVDPDPRENYVSFESWVNTDVQYSKNSAIYFPHIKLPDPIDENRLKNFPPSGTIAGIFARTDAERGVWKAPAGTEALMKGVRGLTYVLTDQENGTLNPKGINCLRYFKEYGNVVWGSRTLFGSDSRASEWKYVPVRRMALFLEESLYRGTQWAVFEPNDEPLWAQIRLSVGTFMHDQFRKGAFQGSKPSDAYFVKCDSETTTQSDINQGIVNILVGFAPLKPAEFVIIKISQMAGQLGAE
ncbi:MAG: phage tail sheath family protein, partial [Candidatus Heimdallarchaeaceae archaeon]